MAKKPLKLRDLRPGQKVHDRWWPDRIFGKVIKVTSRFAHIQTSAGVLRYDGPHCYFLSKGRP